MKETVNINFSGKDYLEYKKYKDEKAKEFWTKENKIIISVLSGIFILGFFITIWINMLLPKAVSSFNYTWEGIGMFLAICIGLGWIAHGVGFLLVRA